MSLFFSFLSYALELFTQDGYSLFSSFSCKFSMVSFSQFKSIAFGNEYLPLQNNSLKEILLACFYMLL